MRLSALFWKEWHENIRWGLLILLCLSVSLVYVVYYETAKTRYSSAYAIPLWDTVNLILTIGAPLAGLSLGLLQILPELRRDQWAFLVHRPITRTTLFFGKVIPGLCLYVLAVSLPLLGFAAWDAAPGHVAAPFDIRFTLGGWAAVCTGVAFYFAGLLTALRPARWYGSRALPVVATLSCPLAANWYVEFWQVALFCLAAAALLGLAAWGSLASGEYERQPKPARLALGTAVYAGILGCTIGLLALTVAISETLFPQPDSAYRFTQYQIDASGRILRVTQDRRGTILSMADSAGRPLPPAPMAWSDAPFLRTFDLAGPPNRTLSGRYNQPERYVQPLQTFLYHSADTAWFFDYGAGQAVGYSEATHFPAAFLGPNGFSPAGFGPGGSYEMHDVGRFPERLSSTDHQYNSGAWLQFPHSVYRFDTNNEAVTQLWPSSADPAAAHLEGACYLTQEVKNGTRSADAYAVAADNRIQVFSGDGTRLFAIPRSYPASAYPFIEAAMNPDTNRFYFWYAPKDDGFPSAGWAPAKIVTVTSRGKAVQTASLPALTAPPHEGIGPAAFGVLLPPGSIVSYRAEGILRAAGDHVAKDVWSRTVHDAGLLKLLAFSALAGLVAALLAWRISRRCGDSRREQIGWALGVFCLGGYGVLLLLALRAWPARVPCPNCGRLRVVDRATCEHCGAVFARPRQDGTEIFEAGPAEAREPALAGE